VGTNAPTPPPALVEERAPADAFGDGDLDVADADADGAADIL
jgi:nuclear cap-binding protein subunit 1